MLKFITGNKTKFNEVQAALAPIKVEQINIDLHEIQEVDPKKIIEHKLKEAFNHYKGEFIIDDSSLFLSCFNYKLPGPLIKWFNDSIGTKKIYEMCKKMGDQKARATTFIGYAKSPKEIEFFEGTMNGKIIKPKGKYNFGYDPIFVPNGKKETLSQMKASGNFFSSPRGLAVLKLKKYLSVK
ncbi:MAG: non-canonical purine NTP pyrophosphatase [Candidatus Doudnabacteria bacterium]|nr:non-canonical purine NTP pyrophosphatase [Candidatus Doudnabacteria bacterium]